MVIPNSFEAEKWIRESPDIVMKTLTDIAPVTVKQQQQQQPDSPGIRQKKTALKELTKEQKLAHKIRSMENSLESIKGHEKQFSRFMRMIMRQKGLHVPHVEHRAGSPGLQRELSYTSITKHNL